MPAFNIMSDGAGAPPMGAGTPDDFAKLQQIFGLSGPVGTGAVDPMGSEPALVPIPRTAGITLQHPGQGPMSPQEIQQLREMAGGVPLVDPDAAVLEKYGIDPQAFMGEPVGYDPSRFEQPLPLTAPRTLGAAQGEDGLEMLDAGVQQTVPGSAPNQVLEYSEDPFAARVQGATDILRSSENQQRYFDIASKETTESIMRAVEAGEMDTATALAILNTRARLGELERSIHAEDTVAKRPRRNARTARNEALYRAFLNPDDSPYVGE